DGADVVLGEDPFHGDRVGPVVAEPLLDALFDAEQPRGEFVLGGGAHGPRGDHGERAADGAVDHAHAAPGQSRVDSQYAHRSPVSRTLVRRAYPPRRPRAYPGTRAPRPGPGRA